MNYHPQLLVQISKLLSYVQKCRCYYYAHNNFVILHLELVLLKQCEEDFIMIVGNKLLLIAIAIVLPLVILLVIGTQTYENIITFQHQTKFIEETHQLILSLQNLL